MHIRIAAAFALLISIASTQPTHATAFAGGFGNTGANLSVGFSLINRGSGSLEALSFTAVPVQQSASSFSQGNASAIASTGGFGGRAEGADRLIASASIRVGVEADAFGHAIAEVAQVVAFTILNTSEQQLVFDVRSFYAINTRVTVEDILTESVLAYWNIGVRFDGDQSYGYGEFGRTIDCSFPVRNSACPNFYDSNDDIFPPRMALDPGGALEGKLIAIARYEATAVPEPPPAAILAISTLALFAMRRRTLLQGRKINSP